MTVTTMTAGIASGHRKWQLGGLVVDFVSVSAGYVQPFAASRLPQPPPVGPTFAGAIWTLRRHQDANNVTTAAKLISSLPLRFVGENMINSTTMTNQKKYTSKSKIMCKRKSK